MPWETILVAVVAGFVGAMLSTMRKSPKQETSPKHIRCESFELVDAAGAPRILMKMLPQGCPILYFTNPEGKPSMRLWVSEKGMPQFDLTGGGNDVRAALLLGEHGEPGLLLSDNEGNVRGRFSMDHHGTSHLLLDGRKSESAVHLMQGAMGNASIAIEENKGYRALLCLMPRLGDKPGTLIFHIKGDSKGLPLSEALQQPTKGEGCLSLMSSGETFDLMIDGDFLYPKRRNEPTESGVTTGPKSVPNEE